MSTRTLQVLLVETSDAARAYAAGVLREFGHCRVVEAHSGREATALATTEEIDLVVADMSLNDMTGRELLDRLQARRPSLKAVFTRSADLDGPSAVTTVRKPYTPGELLGVVTAILRADRN